MSPQLTEAWASGYLQIVIVFLVFALGIPALIFQLSVPEEIKKIIHKYHSIFMRSIIVYVSFLTLFSMAYIWWIHPCSTLPSNLYQIMGSLIITLTLIFTVIFWWKNSTKLLKESLINKIEKVCISEFISNGELTENRLDDIIYLGQNSDSGSDKLFVLCSISNIIDYVLNSEKYKGGELEYLFRFFNDILCLKKKGNLENYLKAFEILKKAEEEIIKRNNENLGDIIVLNSTLEFLSISCVSCDFDNRISSIMSYLSDKVSIIFKIGIHSLECKKYHLSIMALSKLETIATDEEFIKGEKSYYLLGLISYFWNSGISQRMRAKEFIDLNIYKFHPNIKNLINESLIFFYNQADFETVNKLLLFKKSLTVMRRKSSFAHGKKLSPEEN